MRKISILIKNSGEDTITHLLQMPYYKIYALTESGHEPIKTTSNRIVYLSYTKESQRKKIIKDLISDRPRELIIPFFRGDSYSKYAIHTWNQYSHSTIDWRLFKYKNKMNEFIGMEKKSLHLSYYQCKDLTYEEITKQLNTGIFIIKPTNKASSMGVFKIKTKEDWTHALGQIIRGEYVVEEYYSGDLHSVDFYFDGNNVLLLCALREIALVEGLEDKKYSSKFIERYGEEVEKNFSYFLPLRYDIPYNKIHTREWEFLKGLGEKLKEIGYKGFIHLEYKFDKSTQKIGFVEWGGRLGAQRLNRIKHIHYFDVKSLLYDIHSGDISKRKAHKGCHIFKDSSANIHYVGMYSTVVNKHHIGSVLTSYKNSFYVSYSDHIIHEFSKLGITIKSINIYTKTIKGFFYPSYQGGTSFKIHFEIDDENFKKFREKKIEIIEKLVFL